MPCHLFTSLHVGMGVEISSGLWDTGGIIALQIFPFCQGILHTIKVHVGFRGPFLLM